MVECATERKSEPNINPVLDVMSDSFLRASCSPGWRLVDRDMERLVKLLGEDAGRPAPYRLSRLDGDA